MNSPVVIIPVVPIVPEVKAKGKGRAKKNVDQPVLSTDADAVTEPIGDATLPHVDPDPVGDKPRKNLIAKHALLHSFTLFLANKALHDGLFDQSVFDRFLRLFGFFDDVSSLSSFFDALDLKSILKDAKAATRNEMKAVKEQGKKKGKSKKADSNKDLPTDLISSLVNLANGTEPVADNSSPRDAQSSTDAANAPVKQKRKYTRKPKVSSIAEDLQKTDADEE